MAAQLTIAAVVAPSGESRGQSGRERALAAVVQIGSATTAPRRDPFLALPSPPPFDDRSSDGLLAQIEEALAEEMQRAQSDRAAPERLDLVRARLLDVRAARERNSLASALEEHHGRRQRLGAVSEAEGGANVTMGSALVQRLTRSLRVASPVLGLLVNVLV